MSSYFWGKRSCSPRSLAYICVKHLNCIAPAIFSICVLSPQSRQEREQERKGSKKGAKREKKRQKERVREIKIHITLVQQWWWDASFIMKARNTVYQAISPLRHAKRQPDRQTNAVKVRAALKCTHPHTHSLGSCVKSSTWLMIAKTAPRRCKKTQQPPTPTPTPKPRCNPAVYACHGDSSHPATLSPCRACNITQLQATAGENNINNFKYIWFFTISLQFVSTRRAAAVARKADKYKAENK